MSQIGRSVPGFIPPGGMVGTLTGNTGGAVPPDGAANIDVVADATSFTGTGNAGPTGYLINGTPGSNLLALQPNAYTLNIPPSTTGILFDLTVATNTSVTISIEVAGFSDDAANQAAGGFFIGTAYNIGAGAVILPTVDQQLKDTTVAPVLTWDFQNLGSSVQVLIENSSATVTWDMTAFIRYTIQS